MSSQRRGPVWLVFHTLSPSAASLVTSLVLVVLLVGFHLLLLSQDADLLLPHFAGTFNDQLAQEYAINILGPLDRAFGNSIFGTLSTALVWGFLGWAIYAVADFIIINVKDLRESERDITMPLKSQVIRHPLYNQLVIRLLWRFLWGMVLIAVTIALQPVVANLFRHDIALLRSPSATEMLRHAGIVLGGWLAIFQLYVVLFRLFVLRTRVFGEIIY
jgi:hypothetical protein